MACLQAMGGAGKVNPLADELPAVFLKGGE